jgi:cytochrome c oxidase subunit 2
MIFQRQTWMIGVAAASLAGCGGRQSVLDPNGPQANQIAQVSWLLFAAGTAILLVVVLAVFLAIRGPARLRALLASAHTVVWAGIVFPVVTLSALLGHGIWLTRAATVAPDDADALGIAVAGEQWWWRVGYPNGDRTIATANEIRIPAGRTILFTLTSADVIHSFWVPSLGGKVDMIPGRTTHLRLTAHRPGSYRGQCAEYCGGPHALMTVRVIAMPDAEFESWRTREAAPVLGPANDMERRGQAVFLNAGCGACHAVRGTAAAGTIGPDLTHLGARRSVGVETLPMTAENLARFIADGQHIKPGNTMPPFRVFSREERDALTGYLLSLR